VNIYVQMQYSESPQEQSDYMDDEEEEDPDWLEEEVEDEELIEEQDPLFQSEQECMVVDVKPHLKALEDVLVATWVCDVCNDEFDTYESLQEHVNENYCPGVRPAESDMPHHYFASSRHKPSSSVRR